MLDNARGDRPDPDHTSGEAIQSASQVGGQKFAFFLAHFDQLSECALERLFDRRPNGSRIKSRLGGFQNTGHAQQRIHGDCTGQLRAFLEALNGFQVSQGQRLVEFHRPGAFGGAMVSDDRIDPPPRQMRVNFIPDPGFKFDQFFRQVNGNIALLAIDGIQFHSELESILCAFPPPVTGHGSHHGFLTRIRHTVLYTKGQRKTSQSNSHAATKESARACGCSQ